MVTIKLKKLLLLRICLPALLLATITQLAHANIRDAAYVELQMAENRTYVNQPITCTLVLYSPNKPKRIFLPQYSRLIQCDNDCAIQELTVWHGERTNNSHGEMGYVVARYQIIPRIHGSLKITTAPINVIFENKDYSNKHHSIAGVSTKLKIRDMPPAPAEYSGLFGDVTAETNISSMKFNDGERGIITVTLQGVKNHNSIVQPEISFPQPFSVDNMYRQVYTECDGHGELSYTLTFTQIFICYGNGYNNISVRPIIYFNPRTGTYQNLELPEYTILVKKRATSDPGQININRIKSPTI